jgi:hypothetical protein
MTARFHMQHRDGDMVLIEAELSAIVDKLFGRRRNWESIPLGCRASPDSDGAGSTDPREARRGITETLAG